MRFHVRSGAQLEASVMICLTDIVRGAAVLSCGVLLSDGQHRSYNLPEGIYIKQLPYECSAGTAGTLRLCFHRDSIGRGPPSKVRRVYYWAVITYIAAYNITTLRPFIRYALDLF